MFLCKFLKEKGKILVIHSAGVMEKVIAFILTNPAIPGSIPRGRYSKLQDFRVKLRLNKHKTKQTQMQI